VEKKVAALVGLSPAPFSRYFRQRMGRTFVTYVNEVRINEACRRLEEQNSTIVQIAFETGFNHLSNFNRHFQKLRGMTPSEYRRLHKGNSSKK
jgi:AraC-like DNA-binding protein